MGFGQAEKFSERLQRASVMEESELSRELFPVFFSFAEGGAEEAAGRGVGGKPDFTCVIFLTDEFSSSTHVHLPGQDCTTTTSNNSTTHQPCRL